MSEISESIQNDMRDVEGGWVTSLVECGECAHRWIAVWPLDLERADADSDEALIEGAARLECPACSQQGQTKLVEESL
jgi:hypothetical protein